MRSLVLLLAILTVAPWAVAGELLTVANPVADRGEVRSGMPLVQQFELKNSHVANAIAIDKVEMTCGCGRFELQAKQILAGSATSLKISINTLTQTGGANTWKAVVSYRCGEEKVQSTLELTIKATIVQEIKVEPPVLAISTAQEFAQTITVSDRRAKPLTVTRSATMLKDVKIDIRPSTRVGDWQKQEIGIIAAESMAPGVYEDQLVLYTDDSTCPVLRVPIKIVKRRADELSISPASPTIRLAREQTEGSTIVQLRAGGKAVAITAAECSNAGIKIRFAEQPGSVATIRVIVDRSIAGPAGSADVIVQCSQPMGAKVTIPVTWTSP